MKVHHLNCGTMCPMGARLFGMPGGILSPARMVCHCLLAESRDGLVLVDTGLGLDDVARPKESLGGAFVAMTRAVLDPEECAVRQVTRLGFSPTDVRHIVLTHMDLDHAGGLRDFPHAKVHVYRKEHAAATARATLRERERYRLVQWSHGPQWALHDPDGENWFGFQAVRSLDKNLGDEILMIPVHGHTRGHVCVGVRDDKGWVLHCGDAYFHRGEMHPTAPSCPPALALFQTMVQIDGGERVSNQARLRGLFRDHGAEVRHFCAHDPVELEDGRWA